MIEKISHSTFPFPNCHFKINIIRERNEHILPPDSAVALFFNQEITKMKQAGSEGPFT